MEQKEVGSESSLEMENAYSSVLKCWGLRSQDFRMSGIFFFIFVLAWI